jgi:Chaperone of endosialidase
MKTNIIYPALAGFAFTCFALLPIAQAVSPPPDGGYPGANTAEGQSALLNLTTGRYNTAVGYFSLLSDATGIFNTAVGAGTLLFNTGDQNTATGVGALLSNTTGTQNTANGAFALFSNTTESFNTATGFQALFSNTGDGGHYNVADGYQALYSNTTGRRNVAEGNAALYSNTIGSFNTAVGDSALFSLTTVDPSNGNGLSNTAIGELALANVINGAANTAMGESALVNIITGYQNIAVGYVAGQNLTTGNNNIYISNPSVDTESNTIRIGNVVGFTDIYGYTHAAHSATYIAGIYGATTSDAGSTIPVYVDMNGNLGTVASAARLKKEIRPMDKTSEAILALTPVTFQYKSDSKGTPQFGLIAEEVAKVNPDLVVRDRNGEIYTVRYEALNAMLLNEFLKAHRRMEEQEATIAELKQDFQSRLVRQQKQIEALTAGLQKVSAQLELKKPAPQTVKNTD